jgi:DNA-binding NtrC family response regulator
LEKIMFNLLSNAVKFTPGGGSITVKLSPPVPAASAPLKRSWPHGPPRQLVRISVSDTGVGIPPAELESIFTRFGQAKSTGPGGYGGTGIGLALVKELAELHYGEIQVTSEPGQGTEFTLWLPWDKAIYKETEVAEPLPGSDPAPVVLSRLFTEELKSADRQEPAGEEEQAERGQAVRTFAEARKKAILLVEDDASLRAYLKHVLEDTYLVHEAGDGRTGLQSARTHRPDLIVSDWLMPLMNGQELLAAIREQAETAHIPFIMITANGPAGGWDQAQAPAPDDYLTKPFSPAELLVRIRNVLLLAAYRKEYLFTDSRLYLVPSAEIPAGLSRSSGGHKSRFPQEPILIVDDDPLVLTCYQTVLAGQGITNLILCRDSRQVMSLLLKKQVTAVLLDLSMPYVSGDELLKEIKKEFPSTTVIMVTGIQLTAVAVDCMKNGAYDYLVKPVEVNRLVALIQHCIEQKTLEAEVSLLQDTLQGAVLKTPEAFAGIVTQDAAMFDLFRLVEAFAAGTKPVLITGESGTGKELIADVLHRLSGRPGKFIKENIAGLDSTVFSDTLLGHTRGAFTGALDTRKGLVEEAEGGTLFLDEIGELEPDAQVKLLRLLEYGEYRPLGSDKIKRADVRIIVATNADLTAKIKEGTFRKDLYYRLAYKLHIPPLRERPADVPLLAEHFWKRAAQVRGKPVPLPAGLPALLQTYHYPGNIRELELMVESALSLCERPEQFLAYFGEYIGQHTAGSGLLPAPVPFSLRGLEQWFNSSPKIPALTEVEDLLLREAMKKAKGNQRLAAGWLGLSPSALNRRLKKTKL